MAFGTEIKRLRNVHHVSAQVLANAIGIDSERLRSWEKQDLNPRSDDKMAIEHYFGMPLEQLVKLDKLPKVPTQSEAATNNNNMAKATILKKLLQKLDLNIDQFEKEIGVGHSAVAKAIARGSDISDNLIRKILKRYPAVNEHWLMTGEGEVIVKSTTNNTATPIDNQDDYRTKYEKLLERTNGQLSDAMANMSLIIQEMKEVKISLDDSKMHFSRITASQMELMEKIADRLGVSDLPEAALATAQPAYTSDSK